MSSKMQKGADIVIHRWCQLKRGEKLLIITDHSHLRESAALQKSAEIIGAFVVTIVIPENCTQAGTLFDSMLEFLLSNDVIIGATNYSLITTRAVREVLTHGSRYLSLPLSTNNGRSMLAFDFMGMDPEEARRCSANMIHYLNESDTVRITTPLGTNLTFGKKGRTAGLFHGMASHPGQVGSSSFEVYIGIEETKTNGHAILDGSMGYVGRPPEHIQLEFRDGRLASIEHNESGIFLQDYMERFGDPGIFVAGELGIGLNKKSRCLGNCYIEDESTYGTFHIGMGRNLALGGVHDAAGHFDLVFHSPTIYAGDVVIMKDGLVVAS